MKADLVIFAKVYTENEKIEEACAVADGRIIAVGSAAFITDFIGDDTEVINAKENFLMPGFVEGHAHISFASKTLNGIDLSGCKTEDECR